MLFFCKSVSEVHWLALLASLKLQGTSCLPISGTGIVDLVTSIYIFYSFLFLFFLFSTFNVVVSIQSKIYTLKLEELYWVVTSSHINLTSFRWIFCFSENLKSMILILIFISIYTNFPILRYGFKHITL